jgi:acyl-CoA thioesterase-2
MSSQFSPQKLVDDLVALLTVTPRDGDLFEGAPTPPGALSGTGRVFGGQVVAQALAAAAASAPEDRPVHSLHAYFLRMGDSNRPIEYHVARDLDGGTFSNRRVQAIQGERLLLSLSASFQRLEPGLNHRDEAPQVPGPETLPSEFEERLAELHRYPGKPRDIVRTKHAIEQRTVERLRWIEPEALPPLCHTWWRAAAPIPSDDPRVHCAVLAYASDLAMLRTAALPHAVSWISDSMQEASLDHSIWFHDDFRADEWLLFVTRSPWAGRARGYTTGQMFQNGRLIASTAQEAMIRMLKPKGLPGD